MTASRAELLLGADYEGDESFCHTVVNSIKNHFRVSNPCINMTERQPGEILSDPDDDKLYHVGGESGHPCDEILQAIRSCNVVPEFKGVDYYDSCNGDYATIRGIDEPGLGHRLTVGLDETTRTMVICDLGDIDVDFGLAPTPSPTLYVMRETGAGYASLEHDRLYLRGDAIHEAFDRMTFRTVADLDVGNAFRFLSLAGIELTDTNAEQAWVYIEPKIRQTLTAGYVAILVNVTETTLGDASAGAGYNALMDLRIAGVSRFRVENNGDAYLTGDFSCPNIQLTAALIDRDVDDGDIKIRACATDEKGASIKLFGANHAGFPGDLYLDYGDLTAVAPAGAALTMRAFDNAVATIAFICDISGHVFLPTIRNGATQAAAGAAANELWKTNGHAHLEDNVVMIGV